MTATFLPFRKIPNNEVVRHMSLFPSNFHTDKNWRYHSDLLQNFDAVSLFGDFLILFVDDIDNVEPSA